MKTKKISYKLFKNGLGMSSITDMFFSCWESNRFQTQAENMGLIKLIQVGPRMCLFFQVDSVSNIGVKNIVVEKDSGLIVRIEH